MTTGEELSKAMDSLPGELSVGWYLVAFVDVLGQRHLLQQIYGLPEKTDYKQLSEFYNLLKKTAGTVILLRDVFNRFFKTWDKQRIDLSELTSEQKELSEKFRSNPLKSQIFSDSIVLFMSLRNDVNKVPNEGRICRPGICSLRLSYNASRGARYPRWD